MNIFNVQFAEQSDITEWMKLVEIVKDNFPGIEMESYRKLLIKNVNKHTAICAKYEDKIVGILLFSYNQKCLSCMAVHPNYRRMGIASQMIKKMIESFPHDTDISVTTFREGDPMGTAPRAFYKKFGFMEDELIEEFNYPCQRFILHIS